MSNRKAWTRVPWRLGWLAVPIVLSAAAATIPATLCIAADQKLAAPQPEASASDSTKPVEIDPQDAKWLDALRDSVGKKRGKVSSDKHGDVALLNDDYEVVGLCTGCPSPLLNDKFLREYLARFPKVERVYLRGTPGITDDGLAALGDQAGLRRLIVAAPKVTDAGIAHLAKLTRLESLSIRSDLVTDKGLETIAQLSALKNLYLYDTQITSDGLRRLRAALPNCSIQAETKK